MTVEHTRIVDGPPQAAYDLVADVRRWPAVFGPTVHAEREERDGRSERIRLWALVNGEVASWTSRRELDPDGLRVRFAQERSQPPVASMGGEWIFRPLPGGRTEVVLLHDFAAVGGDPEALAWIDRAVDRNSVEELAALARIVELGHPVDDIVFTFADTVRLAGNVRDAYDFVDRADAWPERLPHVRHTVLREDTPGVQHLEMDTVTSGGAVHHTRSVRVCHAPDRIAYKQLVPPALLLGHSGVWEFRAAAGGATEVTARHTVTMNPARVAEVLGDGVTLAEARAWVRDALGKNSRATLGHAGEYAAARSAAAQ